MINIKKATQAQAPEGGGGKPNSANRLNNANRIINVFVITSLLFLLLTGFAAANPIEIRTLEDLMKIDDSSANLSKNYTLMNDIDVAASPIFEPIGNPSNPFTGSFDGRGNTISNITFSDDIMDYVGLFSHIDGASIFDLSLENIDLEGHNYVGGLVGYMYESEISEIYANGTVTGEEFVGGLVGSMSRSEISESYANSTVTGSIEVGGLVGAMYYDSEISESYATGDVSGDMGVGGLVGYM
jgi:The GLUG motif.